MECNNSYHFFFFFFYILGKCFYAHPSTHAAVPTRTSAGFGVVPDSEAAPCCVANIPAKKSTPYTALIGRTPGSSTPGTPTG